MRGMAVDLWQGVVNGFASGLGVGMANWLLIKRLERFETKIKEGVNGKRTIEEGKQKQ